MNQNCATSSISEDSTRSDEGLELESNPNQLSPISKAIQNSFYRTKLVIDKAHSDYLNRIMEAKANLAHELKSELKQMQKEITEEIKTTIQNEQRLLMEKLENATSPQSCYNLIEQHIATLNDIVILANKEGEQSEKIKINIVDKHKELIRSNQYKLQDLHTRFIAPLRNSVQCVATTQHLPNVGDTIQINDGVFDEGYGNYKQYVLHDEEVECNLSFEEYEQGSSKSNADRGNSNVCNSLNDRDNSNEEVQSCKYDGDQSSDGVVSQCPLSIKPNN